VPWRQRPLLEALEDRTLLSISVPPPGQSGPAIVTGTPGNDQYVIRLLPVASPGNSALVAFSDNGGASFTNAPLADITSVTINGLGGFDSLILDNVDSLIGKAGGLAITWNGGGGFDHLIIRGNAGPNVTETYSIGPALDTGTLTTTAGTLTQTVAMNTAGFITDTQAAASLTINFQTTSYFAHIGDQLLAGGQVGVEVRGINFPIEDTGANGLSPPETMPPTSLGGGNGGTLPPGSLPPVSVFTRVSFNPIQFANKTAVTVNMTGGNNHVVLDVGLAPLGLKSLTLNGGPGTSNELIARSLPPGVTLKIENFQIVHQDASAEVFIQDLYLDLLHRVAADSEVNLWMPVLQQQGDQAVATGISNSLEARTQLVDGWYAAYLGRQPANNEEMPWVNLLGQGESAEQVLGGILSSQEFQQHTGSLFATGTAQQKVIDALYALLLGRTPASAEVNAWLSVWQAAGLQAVIQGFLHSNEFRSDVVTGLYLSLLHRAPDQAGLQAWISSNLGVATIRIEIAASGEFAATG
jgi:hypothetical protein